MKNNFGVLYLGFKGLLTCILLLFSALSFSQGDEGGMFGSEVSLGLLKNAGTELHDQVSDGCWTNSRAVKNRVLAKLEQAGINTFDEPLAMANGFNANIILNTVGYRTGGGICTGYFEYFVRISNAKTYYVEDKEDQWIAFHGSTPMERGVLFTSQENLNEQVLSAADSYTDELITLVYKGRRNSSIKSLIESASESQATAITRKELNEKMSNY